MIFSFYPCELYNQTRLCFYHSLFREKNPRKCEYEEYTNQDIGFADIQVSAKSAQQVSQLMERQTVRHLLTVDSSLTVIKI